MSVRTHFVEKWNFTNRKRIKQKPELILVEQLNRNSNEFVFKVQWDEENILKQSGIDSSIDRLLVLDVLFLGNTHRFELPEGGSTEEFVLEDCPDNAILEFRLKLVSNDEATRGILLAATSPFKLQAGPGTNDAGSSFEGFFSPDLSDSLGSRIWSVTWPAPDMPVISLNRAYFNKSKDQAYFPVHVFPEILRAVVVGLLLNNEDLNVLEEGSPADDWLKFVEQSLEYSLRGEDAELPDGNEERLELSDKIVTAFTEKKWRNGKTLLEEFV
ncbi:hypothetical protein HAD_13009 [Hyphomonas adhaerens MHS-3]|uniref:Uncharacterized protein n=1 Tax=Hyphomonas adhaerens MHS-3 TaxID=1280949 RepID=A0A069E1S0_9PROT|nr:hypothetical protein [Hyphomonas adhaerens]KCZ83524.1 hypothetical protein HAD_13009 [Hyphomonas adhaerens MHS-3]